MRRSILAVFALTLAACAPDATSPITPPDHALTARKPRPHAADVPLSIAPEATTIAVGDTVTFTSTYNVTKAAEFSTFYWGCVPYSECWDVVFIVPRADLDNTAATVIGVAPGVVQVYVADGLGAWGYATVTVQ